MRFGSVAATIVLAVLASPTQAADESVILKFSGEATEAIDFVYRLCRPAGNCNTTWSAPPAASMSVSAEIGTTANELRDGCVGATGAYDHGMSIVSARRVSFQGAAAIRFDVRLGETESPGSIIAVKRSNDQNWNNLEPNIPITISGITFTVIEPDLGVAASSGSVPAVSAWGLAALGLAVLVAASVLLRQRAGHAA